MKKQLLTTTFIMTLASTAAFAHHPSADVNPNYDRVDENISDMHNTVIDARIEEGDDMGGAGAGTRFAGREDMDIAMGADDVETIGLFGDVTSALAE